ncbi:hypothetical protein [Roseomonas alba]|nr:hypothetical protein [Neoroseomonas alba]
MTDRPIIFSAPMVRALLDGRKTMTRRLAWGDPFPVPEESSNGWRADGCKVSGADDTGTCVCWHPSPWQRVQAGDRLWVKESYFQFGHWEPVPGALTRKGRRQKWRFVARDSVIRFDGPAEYRTGRHAADPATHAWHLRMGRFMPRAASRLTLTVTAVRVERLQEISAGNAIREGIAYPPTGMTLDEACEYGVDPRGEFRTLWNSLHGPEAWAANPEVVALTFTVERRNIDAR